MLPYEDVPHFMESTAESHEGQLILGTLEPGKFADVVVWNRDPFSVYALPDLVYIDGTLAFDRSRPPATPRSDFLLGQPGAAR